MPGQYPFPPASSGPGVGSARRLSEKAVDPFAIAPPGDADKSKSGKSGGGIHGGGPNGGSSSSPTSANGSSPSPAAACLHSTAALTASFSVDSAIDESDPFALIQRGLNQQAHNDMWGAADSFGRASIMLKRRSDALLAKEAAHNARVRHRRDDQAVSLSAAAEPTPAAAHAHVHHRGGKAAAASSVGASSSASAASATGFAHRRSDSQSSGGGSASGHGPVGTFNLEGERRSVRREAAEVFKERSREYFRQARESLIAAMAIDTKASSSSESKDPTGPDEQGVRDRCVIFRRLFAPGHTQGGVPTDSSLIQHTSYSSRAPPPAASGAGSGSGAGAAAATSATPTTTAGSSNPIHSDEGSEQIEHEEDLRTLSRRFEELEEMAVSPQDYAPVGGDGDYHSYETSNLIDSNLEPHYSNLIDSANAPIFGVDRQGRVNVW